MLRNTLLCLTALWSGACFAPPPQSASPDENGLLAAIYHHPDEDTPRLAYADWLTEQGGKEQTAQADLIRLEIEVNRTDNPKARAELEKRIEKIARTLPKWLNDNIKARLVMSWTPKRGFIESVTLDPVVFSNHFGAPRQLFKELPYLREIGFQGIVNETPDDVNRMLEQLRKIPLDDRARITTLKIENLPFDRAQWRTLFTLMPQVRFLNIIHTPMSRQDVAEIEQAEFAPHLRSIRLTECGITPTSLEPLTRSRRLAELRYLGLGNNSIGVLAPFHDTDVMPKLSHLVLDHQRVPPGAAQYYNFEPDAIAGLIQAKRFRMLRSLYLDGWEPEHFGMMDALKMAQLPELKYTNHDFSRLPLDVSNESHEAFCRTLVDGMGGS